MNESTRAIISPDGWKLCLRDHDLNELYNLQTDPIETHNRYYDRDHRSIIERLTREIHCWQESVGDSLKL
jgi:hypothetical protein